MKTPELPKARKNAVDTVVTCLSFASDWLRKWCEFSGPITERGKAKTDAIPEYFQHSTDNCLKHHRGIRSEKIRKAKEKKKKEKERAKEENQVSLFRLLSFYVRPILVLIHIKKQQMRFGL